MSFPESHFMNFTLKYSMTSRLLTLALACGIGASSSRVFADGGSISAGSPPPQVSELTMFAFDDHTIPWQHNLKVTLVQGTKHPDNPVLRTGPDGSPDHGHALLYGS